MNVNEDIPFTVPRPGVEWSREGDTLCIRFEDNVLVRETARWLGIDFSSYTELALVGYLSTTVVFMMLGLWLGAQWLQALGLGLPHLLFWQTRSRAIEITLTPSHVVRRAFGMGVVGVSEERFEHDGTCDVRVGSKTFAHTVRLEVRGGDVTIEVDDPDEALELRQTLEGWFDEIGSVEPASAELPREVTSESLDAENSEMKPSAEEVLALGDAVDWMRTDEGLRVWFEGNKWSRLFVRWCPFDPRRWSSVIIGATLLLQVALIGVAGIVLSGHVADWVMTTIFTIVGGHVLALPLAAAAFSKVVRLDVFPEEIVVRTHHPLLPMRDNTRTIFTGEETCAVRVDAGWGFENVVLETPDGEIDVPASTSSEALELRRALEDYFDALESNGSISS